MFYSLGRLECLILFLPYDCISNFEDYINHYVYTCSFLVGLLVLNELHFDKEEQRQLNELLFKGSSESPVPKKNCGLDGILN